MLASAPAAAAGFFAAAALGAAAPDAAAAGLAAADDDAGLAAAEDAAGFAVLEVSGAPPDARFGLSAVSPLARFGLAAAAVGLADDMLWGCARASLGWVGLGCFAVLALLLLLCVMELRGATVRER